MATVGSLAVHVIAPTGQFAQQLNQQRQFLATAVRGLSLLRGVAGAAVFAAGAAFRVWQENAAEIETISRAADRIGATHQGFSALGHAADLSGSSVEGLATGLTYLQKNLGTAAPAFAATLESIGLTTAELNGMAAERQFIAIARGIDQLNTAADKTAVAMQIFGRSGASLLPLLQEGGDEIERMMREAERLGLTFDKTMATKVMIATSAIRNLKGVFTGLVRRVAIWAAQLLARAKKFLGLHNYDLLLVGLSDKEINRLQRMVRDVDSARTFRALVDKQERIREVLGLEERRWLFQGDGFNLKLFREALFRRQDAINAAVAKRHQEMGLADPEGDRQRRQALEAQSAEQTSSALERLGLAQSILGGGAGRLGFDDTVIRAREERAQQAEQLRQSVVTPQEEARGELRRALDLFKSGELEAGMVQRLIDQWDERLGGAKTTAGGIVERGSREAFDHQRGKEKGTVDRVVSAELQKLKEWRELSRLLKERREQGGEIKERLVG